MTTYPQRSRWRTTRSATIEAASASASWTRFRPDHRSANEIELATSSGAAGASLSSMRREGTRAREHFKNEMEQGWGLGRFRISPPTPSPPDALTVQPSAPTFAAPGLLFGGRRLNTALPEPLGLCRSLRELEDSIHRLTLGRFRDRDLDTVVIVDIAQHRQKHLLASMHNHHVIAK